jgi:hypothetical protein
VVVIPAKISVFFLSFYIFLFFSHRDSIFRKATSKSASTGKFNHRDNSRNHHHSTGSEVRALARYQLPNSNHGIPETQHFTYIITETDSSDKTTLKNYSRNFDVITGSEVIGQNSCHT